jgi:glycosyltransferase involved in cell wall biosynthesis
MIGVAIPAHNEEAHLAACLAAALRAAADPALGGEEVKIALVLDACGDASAALAARVAASVPLLIAAAVSLEVIEVDERCVGRARAAGADWLLARGARWLAFTDADSEVAPGWLAAQLDLQANLRAEVVCGTVEIADWGGIAAAVRAHYHRHYADRDGHRHVHGANLGLCAHAYRRAGGFRGLAAHEDVALVEALAAAGARITWSALPRVRTSARLHGRASGGFADHLRGLAQRVLPHALLPAPAPLSLSLSPPLPGAAL